MISESDLLIAGKVNKTHGIDGELSVSFFDGDVADIIDVDTCVFFKIDGIMVPFFVSNVRPRGSESLLLTFDGEDTQEKAAFFVGKDLYISKNDIPEDMEPEDDGFYAAQLIGYTALTDHGQPIGEISDIDDSTENPLFIITRADGATVYIPIVDEFISDIDTDGREITFELPNGLLELS